MSSKDLSFSMNQRKIMLGDIIAERYQIERLLGAGGMGQVFLAKDLRAFDKPVALKVIQGEPQEARWFERFEREARLTAQLNSPHVVNLREFGQLPNGVPFIVMDYLEGETLADFVDPANPPPLGFCLRIMDEVLSGLQDIHALGIVHRDIKPSNVFLRSDASGERHACLIDLGVARGTAELGGRLTAVGKIVGSFNWCAPEQLRTEGATFRSDLYAVGLMMLYALGIEAPHGQEAVNSHEAELHFLRRRATEPVDLSTLRGSARVPDPLKALIERILTPDPERRFEDVGVLRGALREASGGELSALAPALTPQPASKPAVDPRPTPRGTQPPLFTVERASPLVEPGPSAELSLTAARAYPQQIELAPSFNWGWLGGVLLLVTLIGGIGFFAWTTFAPSAPPPPPDMGLRASAPLPPIVDAAPPTDAALPAADGQVAEPPSPKKPAARKPILGLTPSKPAECRPMLRRLIFATHRKREGALEIDPPTGKSLEDLQTLLRLVRERRCRLTPTERDKLKAIAATVKRR